MPRHFGILIPSTNTTCEIEFCRLPSDLQVHTARLGKAKGSPFTPSLEADVAYQAQLLGDARVEVIALAQTSASLFADDYDALTIRRMCWASMRHTCPPVRQRARPIGLISSVARMASSRRPNGRL